MAQHHVDISKDNTQLGGLANKIILPSLVIGLVGLGTGTGLGLTGGDEVRNHFMAAWLVTFLFFVAISLGALFFVLIHHATQAGWSVVVRRIAEAISTNLQWLWIPFLLIAWGMFNENIELFPWATEKMQTTDTLVMGKASYLNTSFFMIRAAIYFTIWFLLTHFMFSNSKKQDETGNIIHSMRMKAVSYPGIMLFALTLTFASFDWIMSQDPHWFSTIFGVYFFAGAVSSFLSVTILIAMFLQKTGRVQNAITTEHYHDLGKLLFAFGIVFWAYIAFSQYMLIWYANIPEETNWYQARVSGLTRSTAEVAELGFEPGRWNMWSLFLMAGHFGAPFILFVSRWPKRVKGMLVVAAIWMAFMCWYDLFWLIMPVFWKEGTGNMEMFPFLEIVLFIGFAGVFIAATTFRLKNVSLVPSSDPRLPESLAFENM